MHIKLFVRDHCPGCRDAERALAGLDGVEVYDLSEVDGLAEAAHHSVKTAPTVLVVSTDGVEVAGWRGEAPDALAVRAQVAQ